MRKQAGFSLVELLIVVAIIGIVSAIAIPRLVEAKKRASEASAIQMLRTVGSAEATYLAKAGRAATLSELIVESALDATMTDGSNHNNYILDTVSVSATTIDFEFAAEPVGGSNVHGDRSFNITQDYVVRYAFSTIAPTGTNGTPLGSN